MLTYGTLTNTAITLASLAGAAARESKIIDNSTTKYDDYQVTIWYTITNKVIGTDKAIYVYLAGANSQGALDYPATGTDAALVMYSSSSYSLNGPMVIPTVNSSIAISKTFTISQFFGGVVPRYWNYTVYNAASSAFTPTETDHGNQYCGIYYVGT